MFKKAYFAGGCFWCTEAIFQNLIGVESVVPGYAGGDTPNPDYHQVSGGESGHADALEVEYNEDRISYVDLLNVFFHTHDPTTLNQQGNDVGTQYRSAIFYVDNSQKEMAEEFISKLEEYGCLRRKSIIQALFKF